LNLPERVHAVDVKYPCMVVATADKKFYVFNLDSPQKPFRVRRAASPLLRLCGAPLSRVLCSAATHASSPHGAHPPPHPPHVCAPSVQEMTFKTPMKMQTRCVKLFNNKQMFAIGSIEGRVALRCVDEAMDNA